jgi:hypothetical protein
MFNTLKITMLGTMGAGKTCFMVGMYAVMRLGVHGFTLSAQNLDDDIDLTDFWERLTEGGKERFPEGTSQPYNYAFDFNYGFKKLMGFEWLDYRGKALLSRSTESEVKELEARLLQSSCVFLCISGEHLAEKIETQKQRLDLDGMTKAGRINQFLKKLQEKRGSVPVVIAITKYDLCMHRKREDFTEDIKALFNPLFTSDGNWLVLICPVSLGKELVGNKFDGKIEPVNLHLPLTFAIYSELMQRGTNLKQQEKTLTQKTTELREKNWLGRWLSRKELTKADKDLLSNKAEMQKLQDKLELLANELGKADIYFNGEAQDVNIYD